MYEDTFHSPPDQARIEGTIRKLRMQYGEEFLLHVADEINNDHGKGRRQLNDEDLLDRMADLILNNPGIAVFNAAKQIGIQYAEHEQSEEADIKRLYRKFREQKDKLCEVAKARQTIREGVLEAQKILNKLKVGELVKAETLKKACMRISPANIDAKTVLKVIDGENAYHNSPLAILRFALGFNITMCLSKIVGLLEQVGAVSGSLHDLYDFGGHRKTYYNGISEVRDLANKLSPTLEYFLTDNIGSLREAYRNIINF